MYEGLSHSQSYLNRHEVVTLASIVEKESLKDWEKPRIASVFHNRLQIGMKLQSDPTVSYGILRKEGSMPPASTRRFCGGKPLQHLQGGRSSRRPYLNPDQSSLSAVLKPEQTSYYYFVSQNDGTHAFNKDFEGHKRDVRSYKRNRSY